MNVKHYYSLSFKVTLKKFQPLCSLKRHSLRQQGTSLKHLFLLPPSTKQFHTPFNSKNKSCQVLTWAKYISTNYTYAQKSNILIKCKISINDRQQWLRLIGCLNVEVIRRALLQLSDGVSFWKLDDNNHTVFSIRGKEIKSRLLVF